MGLWLQTVAEHHTKREINCITWKLSEILDLIPVQCWWFLAPEAKNSFQCSFAEISSVEQFQTKNSSSWRTQKYTAWANRPILLCVTITLNGVLEFFFFKWTEHSRIFFDNSRYLHCKITKKPSRIFIRRIDAFFRNTLLITICMRNSKVDLYIQICKIIIFYRNVQTVFGLTEIVDNLRYSTRITFCIPIQYVFVGNAL